MGMDLKDVGERFLRRGDELRAAGQRLAEIGHALMQMDTGAMASKIPGHRLPANVVEEVEHQWPAVSRLLTDRLLEEGVEITRAWPEPRARDEVTEV